MHSPDDLAERLNEAVLSTFDLVGVYLGDRLGYYRALHAGGPATSAELSTRTQTDERYTREWLEQQAMTGILACDTPEADPRERRYRLPAGYERVLIDPASLTPMAASAQCVVGALAPLPHLVEAYRTGAGVPFAAYGADMGEGQARTTFPVFANLLTTTWFPAIPDLHARLRADPPARVADLGVGHGWSSIAIARAYPMALVDGFDLDPDSVTAARANAAAAGLADRVRFHLRDAGDPELAGSYDIAFAFECVHDMANPVAALTAMRRLVTPGGIVLVVDEKAAESFTPNGDANERMLYGYSIVHCLPVGRCDTPSAETGAVMRPETFRRYAADAGFDSVEIVPIESDGFRFYRLSC
ncbi:MAG: methyltransferase domain-containing protein [Thermomicrobiales bacterium]|nr:methyltransferase domain-containing protein [Thermomicrobiales bacterium]